jgi:hypothetical protein
VTSPVHDGTLGLVPHFTCRNALDYTVLASLALLQSQLCQHTSLATQDLQPPLGHTGPAATPAAAACGNNDNEQCRSARLAGHGMCAQPALADPASLLAVSLGVMQGHDSSCVLHDCYDAQGVPWLRCGHVTQTLNPSSTAASPAAQEASPEGSSACLPAALS